MTTLTATEARKSLYGLLDDVAESHDAIQITGKRSSVILISHDELRHERTNTGTTDHTDLHG